MHVNDLPPSDWVIPEAMSLFSFAPHYPSPSLGTAPGAKGVLI